MLVSHLLKHRLVCTPLRLYLLHELVLSEDALLDEELCHGICLGEAGYNQLLQCDRSALIYCCPTSQRILLRTLKPCALWF